MKEVLVSFKHETDYGSVHGIYVLTKDDWKKIRYLQENNQEISLWGVAGRHSDLISNTNRFTLVSTDENEIQMFKDLFGETFGSYKPIDSALELYDELAYEEVEEDENWQ